MSHEQLWAPWRLEYITGGKPDIPAPDPAELEPGADSECFLCQAIPPKNDRLRLVVGRGEHTITVLNRFPYNNGHLLVAPKRHISRMEELGGEVELELTRTITRLVGVLERVMQPQGFNIGLNLGRAAGAGLPGHIHWHIVPRWIGDTNFMPTIAGIHTIPQSLEALWDLLTAEMTK